MTLITACVYIALLVIFSVIYFVFPHTFISLAQEDKFLEWSTFFGYIVATVGFSWAAWLRHRKHTKMVVFLLLLALGCFFIAGEEISWGQRLIGFDTPELISENNFQNEVTFHNLGEFGRDWPRRLYMILVFLYVVLLPVLVRLSPPLEKLAVRLGVVVPPLVLVVPFVCSVLLPLYIKVLVLFDSELPLYHDYTVELMEYFSALLFVHLALHEVAKARSPGCEGEGQRA